MDYNLTFAAANRSVTQKNYNTIDLIKFIMSIVVVSAHTQLFYSANAQWCGEFQSTLNALPVPFFFLAAGYLLSVKLKQPFCSDENIKVIKNYLIRMLKLYFTWTAIYFPLAVYGYADKGTPFLKAVLQYIRGLIFVGESYYSYILWYLLSSVYALVFILILLKKKLSVEKIAAVGLVIGLISLGITAIAEYQGSLPSFLMPVQKIIHLTVLNGRIFKGIVYIPIGMLLTQVKIPKAANLLMFLASFTANCFISNRFISSVLFVLSAVGLFGFAEALNLKDSVCYKFMRKMSTVIYFIHLYVLFVWLRICPLMNLPEYGEISFLAVSAVTLMIAFLYVYFSGKKKLKN